MADGDGDSPGQLTRSVTPSNSSATDQSSERPPPSLATLLSLSSYQQQQLVQSWPRLRSSGYGSGGEIFKKLSLKSPTVKETFQKANIVGRLAKPNGYDTYKEHGKALFELLHATVKSINEQSCQDLIDMCRQFGGKHSVLRAGNSGFQTKMWDDLAELLVEHITRSEAVRGRRESMRAWTTVVMFIVDKIKDGYDCAVRKSITESGTSDRLSKATE